MPHDAPARRRRGDTARTALLETAERLFAERGIEAVSLRDVSAVAGQRNHSASQYHFGDRQGLVAAVYEARMRHVDERRRALLASLDRDGRTDDVHGLVAATALPLLDVVAETDGWYARFLARTRWDPLAWQVVASLASSGSFQDVVVRVDRALRDQPAAVRRNRIDQLLTLVIGTLAGWEGATDRGETRLSRELLASELVATGVALLTAPTNPARADLETTGANA